MDRKSKKILIVDDEPLILFGLSKTFSDIADVKTVRTGEEACEEIKSTHYDFCILDVYLPGMSGMEVLDNILEISPGTKVMIITAFADDQIKKEIDKKTPLFMEKPFQLAEMKEKVRKII